MPDSAPNSKKSWLKIALAAAVVVALYFLNVEVQTRLGESVLAEVPLEKLSYDDALAKATAEKKPVLADLSAIWCPTCRNMDKSVFSNPEVAHAISQKYIFARIEFESEEGEWFQKRYNTRVFPTLLVLAPDGVPLRELPVTTDPQEFLSFL